MNLNDLGVKAKLDLLLLLCVVMMVGLQTMQVVNEREGMLAERKKELVHHVENAVALIRHFHAQSPALGEAAAREAALQGVASLRYDQDKGYFWINDLDHVMVLHPIKPDLQGVNLRDSKDAAGLPLFQRFVEIVKTRGEGFVDYQWSVPGRDEPVPKTSFVKGFEPWGWVVGTGVYVDDIDALMMGRIWRIGGFSLAALALLILLARLLRESITRPLCQIVQAMKQAARGDLTNVPRVTGRRDELGDLQAGYAGMVEELVSLIDTSQRGNGRLVDAIETLAVVTTQTSTGMQRQSDETTALASAVEELAATIREVAGHASETSGLTRQADDQIGQGHRMMQDTRAAIDEVAQGVTVSSEAMHTLEERIQQIDSVLGVIRTISEQTNLLALNAAIEAARAGDSGRGFAVVADEVRSLAKRTQESTEEIRSMTEALQNESAKAVAAMQQSRRCAQTCVQHAATTGECLCAARDIVSGVRERNEQIAVTVEEQGAVANEVSANVTGIREVSLQTTTATSQLALKGRELKDLVQQTQQVLSHFVLR